MLRVPLAALAVSLLTLIAFSFQPTPDGDWPAYGRDPGGQRFSPLTAINRENVRGLKVAWTFHTGDASQPPHGRATAFEATPIYVEGTLYFSTPPGRVIALDPV